MKPAAVIAALKRPHPRIPIEEAPAWAARYDYRPGDDEVIDAIAPAVRKRGHFTRDEFLTIYAWKTQRTIGHAKRHSDQEIADVTGASFRQTNERLRVDLLRVLGGVEYPVASVLLHVGLSPEYPIIDYRALWSLGASEPSYYSFTVWWAYVDCCRRLAKEAGVSVRGLDRALWAYSEANQPTGTR